MQNQQTPQWLELFTTAFGAKGLVALAWWAGAYHAERIRNLQGTYPSCICKAVPAVASPRWSATCGGCPASRQTPSSMPMRPLPH